MKRAYLPFALTLAATCAMAASGISGCAADADPTSDDDQTVAVGAGGSSQGGASAASTGGVNNPCGVDCAAIQTPDCQVAQCNITTAMCEVVSDEDGAGCDDGLFCTISDSCLDGMCVGGPQNDCGMTPPACTEVTCDEQGQTCSTAPSMDGAMCQEPDLCIKGSTCSNGICLGGMLDNCFFEPVPDDCHVSQCDSADGICKPVIGNENGPCNDLNDLCTVNKTCVMGVCQGGQPMDCSQLTLGCNLGVCDTTNGQCTTQVLMNNDPCDDLDSCTMNEICLNGNCTNGTPVTACVNNDGCCPSNCNATNDIDCACGLDKLELTELNIGTPDYVRIFNPTTCAIDLNPLEIFFDDSSLSDLTFALPSYMLAAGASVYITEGTATMSDEISTMSNIFFSSTRGGAAIMCVGTCSQNTVVDVVAFSEGAPHAPLPTGISFIPSGLSGLTSESTQSYIRVASVGTAPSFLASDWTVGAATN